MNAFKSCLAALGLICAMPLAQAVTCLDNLPASNPDNSYTVDAAHGTVTDTRTGLMWDQCNYGLSGSSCATGSANTYTWAQALNVAVTANTASYKTYKDWRVPSIDELTSLLEECRINPAINDTKFPNTTLTTWTSTTQVFAPSYARSLGLGSKGDELINAKSGTYNVRLVRGGGTFTAYDIYNVIPNTFTFTAETSASVSTLYTSNTVTLGGITNAGGSPISITGGEYQINGGSWVSTSGTIYDGNNITVRQTSSASTTTTTTATLTIGGVGVAYNVTTGSLPAASSDANLGSINFNGGVLSPSFSPAITSYTLSVSTATTSLTVTPTTESNLASVSVNGTPLQQQAQGKISGTDAQQASGNHFSTLPSSSTVTLGAGSNVINIVVTAFDTSTKTYTFNVVRNDAALPSDNAKLGSLSLSAGTLSPSFSPNTLSYTADVPNDASNLSVSAVAQDGGATVAVSVSTGFISINVTAATGAVLNYTISVTRSVPSNANLASLASSAGSLSPVFAPATTGYTLDVPFATTAITLTPTLADSKASMTVNGTALASGATSASFPLAIGSNLLNVQVTAQNGTTTKAYTLTVNRLLSSNADLAGITLSSGTLSPAFSAATTSYAATVDSTTSSLTLSPSLADANAVVSVNGTPVANGGAFSTLALSQGKTLFTILVTAQDGKVSKRYTLTVERLLSNNAELASLGLSSGTLNPIFTPVATNYTASVSNATNAISVTPATADRNAKVTVNGLAVSSGSPSADIPLAVGLNTVSVQVAAADGKSFKTYIVTVTRAIATLTLSGTGTAASGGSYDFGTLTAGSTNSIPLTLTNTGTQEVAEISGITIQPPFSISSNCPAKLAVGASCTVNLIFMPLEIDATRLGRKWTGNLTVAGNASVIGLPFNVSGIAKSKPLPAFFSDATGVDQMVLVNSNEADLGVLAATRISITGGQYAINGGAYTSDAGTLQPGDSVKVQHLSANQSGTLTTTLLTVGNTTYSFRSTTTGKPFVAPSGDLPSGAITVKQTESGAGLGRTASLDVEIDLNALFGTSANRQSFAEEGYQVYLVAYLPSGVLELPTPMLFLKNTQRSWVGVSSPLAAYLENVALNATSKVTISVLSDFNFGLLSGTEFYIGVGTSDNEMLASKRYRAFYRVP